MASEKLVSIIVPIYNTEKYLKRCVDSLLKQSHKEIEIILVDDGSTDSTCSICNDYKKIDDRVIVIHKKNGGLSSARNAGLDKASGDYIGFVDSDDWVSPEMVEQMLSHTTSKREIVCTSVNSVDEFGQEKALYLYQQTSQSFSDFYRSLLLSKEDCSVCSKLFPRNVIGSIRFDETKLNEDILFLFSLIERFDIIRYTSSVGYFYYIRTGSISRQYGKAIHDMVINADTICRLIKEKMPEFDKEAERFALYQKMTMVCCCPFKYDRREDEIYLAARKYIKKNLFTGLFSPFFCFREKLKLILTALCPRIVSLTIDKKRKYNLTKQKRN